MKILLVDDDAGYRDAAISALQREGFSVLTALNGTEGFRLWLSERPEAVLVDVALPNLSGFELCRRIRKISETPLLIVSSSSDERLVLQGFAAGADDYVFKPFSARELSMRIRAVSSRLKGRDEPVRTNVLDVAGVVLDREAHQARFGEYAIHLTPLEFRILDVLASNQDHVVSFSRLVELAWDYGGGTVISLRHHISNLRHKLAQLPGEPLDLHVVYGAGYILRAPASRSTDPFRRDPDRASIVPAGVTS